MTVADWQRVKTIFNMAVDLAAEERTAYLHEVCDGDVALQGEVESLLASHEVADGFLENTAVVQAARLLDEDQTRQWIGRRIGQSVAALIVSDDAETLAQGADLVKPHALAAGEAMNKDHRLARAGIVERNPEIAYLDFTHWL